MSQNNSKNRKSKFSNLPPEVPPSRNDSYNQPYHSNFKPQAPGTQPPQFYPNQYPQNFPSNIPSGYPDQFQGSKSFNGNGNEPYNLSNNNSMNANHLPFYGQNQTASQINQMTSGQKGQNPFEMQQGQFPFYNMGNMGQQGNYQAPMGYQFPPSVGQNFPGGVGSNLIGGNRSESQMVEEKPNTSSQMEIISTENKNMAKRARKDPRGVNEDFEVIHKKTKTEGKYFEKFETLYHELAKIKEFEVQILKTLFNSSQSHLAAMKGKKDFDDISKQKAETSNIPIMRQNLVIQSALHSVPHDALRNALIVLTDDKLKDTNELEQAKKKIVAEARKEEEEEKKEGRMEVEKEPILKVVHVNPQQFYQANPQTKDLEDKMERLEYMLREKRGKIRESTKRVGESKLDVEIAQARREILTQKLQDMGL